ncbi:MAG: hypothetical protein HC844_13100 [Tabrizicola sp.]|nr:hypothetical protein [Tabrizicola sp.]
MMNGPMLSSSVKFFVNTIIAFAVSVAVFLLIDRFFPGLLQGGLVVALVLVYRLFLCAGIRGEMMRAARG